MRRDPSRWWTDFAWKIKNVNIVVNMLINIIMNIIKLGRWHEETFTPLLKVTAHLWKFSDIKRAKITATFWWGLERELWIPILCFFPGLLQNWKFHLCVYGPLFQDCFLFWNISNCMWDLRMYQSEEEDNLWCGNPFSYPLNFFSSFIPLNFTFSVFVSFIPFTFFKHSLCKLCRMCSVQNLNTRNFWPYLWF